MIKTKLLSTASLLMVAGCASTFRPVPCPELPKATPIAVEEPGHFQTNWMELLQTFKARLEALSSGATN